MTEHTPEMLELMKQLYGKTDWKKPVNLANEVNAHPENIVDAEFEVIKDV